MRDVRSMLRVRACRARHVLSTANGPLDADVLFVAEAVGRRGGAVTGVPLTRDESGKRFAAFLDIRRHRPLARVHHERRPLQPAR